MSKQDSTKRSEGIGRTEHSRKLHVRFWAREVRSLMSRWLRLETSVTQKDIAECTRKATRAGQRGARGASVFPQFASACRRFCPFPSSWGPLESSLASLTLTSRAVIRGSSERSPHRASLARFCRSSFLPKLRDLQTWRVGLAAQKK